MARPRTKSDRLLDALVTNLGEWTCSYCNSDSNQPAATFRQLKNLGYQFEEALPNRWGQSQHCETCGGRRTHYKLLASEPVIAAKPRIAITGSTRQRLLKILDNRDAFTGATITSTPEIDHKVPFARLKEDIDAATMTDDQLGEHFQLLTREHNLLKDRACGRCKSTGKRTPFLGIPYWYEGDGLYEGSCEGCGWYDGMRWREAISSLASDGEDLNDDTI